MQKPNDNSKSSHTALVQDSTLIAVIELSLSSWLVAGLVPGQGCSMLSTDTPLG